VSLAKLLVARKTLALPSNSFRLLWVTDFPLFELSEAKAAPAAVAPDGRPTRWTVTGMTATHHPFTAPVDDDAERLRRVLSWCGAGESKSDAAASAGAAAAAGAAADVPRTAAELLSSLGSIRAQHYDLVMNGVELGGGSIRIHNADTQKRSVQQAGSRQHAAQSTLVTDSLTEWSMLLCCW
jgi:aspartyl-tRNA synthetase